MNGCTVNVIFTGKNYFFFSEYYGVLAVAERNINDSKKFSVTVGNARTIGGRLTGSAVYSAACRFIRKSENKFVESVCSFERGEDKPLADHWLSVKLV